MTLTKYKAGKMASQAGLTGAAADFADFAQVQ
jgi:hypothetical protein